ncbi:hypothetical protein FHS19_006866 [Paenibacillus rhizosphaerae]|uniref:Uncharacterized protein n=1 Tax=Paenibacillus rhizosphaerae TaxID=297318 RepID=A0A839U3V9_9BACL|nr:hypothetical protein [Paenibacillus rhizosphaerae]MBB3132139.1 hypothetical protein [Paenibacillus rhizosphaerae]
MNSRFMKPLTSPIHFHTAMIEQIPVAVFTGQEMIGSGKIVEITDFAVKIGDEFYVREACTFKYAV